MAPSTGIILLSAALLGSFSVRAQSDSLVHKSLSDSLASLAGAGLASQPIQPTAGQTFTNTFFYGALSASYTASDNWGGQSLQNYAFAGNVLYRHGSFRSGRSHTHQVMADLGYLKFVDSIWVKNIDRFQLSLLWNGTSRRLNQSYSVAFGTQFLPNTVVEYDFAENTNKEKQVGGFLNPFTLDVGYGAVWAFWNTSNINFAFATLRLSSSPKATTAPAFSDAHTIEGDRAYYFMTYGFSIAAAINKPFGEHVQWINNTRVFGNGVDRDHVNFDFGNMVIVKLWKYLQIRLDTRLAYNPMLNYKMQFRQEVLVGFFYERNR